ncbi:MAG: glycosyltransferase [Deltaproteobacteria bacterium]|nr:glycosyltransferase [bacterium]MCB9476008.1 glycosyltransferase [Deltaproteobacteria bacterium]MCB9487144.1 glycosyltransferase [Deltaproteobacteria bacterium]
MASPDVDIIVANKTAKAHLVRCLEYIYGQVYDGRIHTTVVDNHSMDGSTFGVNSRYPQVQLFENEVDTGQAAAFNLALAHSDSPYVLFLSSDCELEPTFVGEQVAAMEGGPKIGGLAGHLISTRETMRTELTDSAGIGLKGVEPILLGNGRRLDPLEDKPREVFGPAGAAMFYSRECLENVAPDGMVFDEDLNFRHLDVDLAWRARWLGWKFWYNPKAVAAHHRGQIYVKDPERRVDMQRMTIRNHYLVYRKNLLFDGWRDYKGKLKAAVRSDVMAFGKLHGVGQGAGLWVNIRAAEPSMIKKNRALERRATVAPDSLYREIFSSKALSQR